MKNMKTKELLAILAIAMICVSCEPPTPEPISVTTGEVSWLTTESVSLLGLLDGDMEPYMSSMVFGFYFSTDEAAVVAHTADTLYTRNSDRNREFGNHIEGLTAGTTYYYCAWVMVNATDYIYGEVKSFTTPTTNLKEMAFSVSPTQKVYFSSGNLQYHPLNNLWRFAIYQFDYIGDDNKYIAPDYDGWIDLFGWGTSDNPTLCTAEKKDYDNFIDWGGQIIDEQGNQWRTLTATEWDYLCNKRPNAAWLCKYVTVEGVLGVLLVPDGTDLLAGAGSRMSKCYWFTLEQKGAIFLPCAGRRIGKQVHAMQDYGRYWSATRSYTGNASALMCTPNEKFKNKVREMCNGYSVRLVRNVE